MQILSLRRESFPALPLLGGIASLCHRQGAGLEPGRVMTALGACLAEERLSPYGDDYQPGTTVM